MAEEITFFTKPYTGGFPDNVEIFYRAADGTEMLAYNNIHKEKAHIALRFLMEDKDKLQTYKTFYRDKELQVVATDYERARRMAGEHFGLYGTQWQSLTVACISPDYSTT
jgi:hypothetical protein